jgi:hypothetical protein
MIEIIPTEEMIEQAKLKSHKMGALNHSITNGDGNFCGFLGELIANSVIGGTIINSYDFDILGPNNVRYDIKTKRCTSKPKPHYECSIAAYNMSQNCDVYVFVRVLQSPLKGWILGYYPKNLYFNKARFLKIGDFDSSNSFFVKADCYNLKIEDLIEFSEKT